MKGKIKRSIALLIVFFIMLSSNVGVFAVENPGITGDTATPVNIVIDKQATPTDNLKQWKVNLSLRGVKDIPTTSDIVLVIDKSGSMNSTRLAAAKKAAKLFVNTLLSNEENTLTRIALVSFSDKVTKNLVFKGASEKDSLITAIDSIKANGGTFIQAAIKEASQLLSESSADKKSIVLLGDGGATYSYKINNPDKYLETWGTWGIKYYRTKADILEKDFIYNSVVGNGSNEYTSYNWATKNYRHGASSIAEAGFAKAKGQVIYTIALETDREGKYTLDGIASPEKSYTAVSNDLQKIFQNIAGSISYGATDATIIDPMGEKFSIPGINATNYKSKIEVNRGTISWDNDKETITWKLDTISENNPATMTYLVEIDEDIESGTYPTNGPTIVSYKDASGQESTQEFEVPEIKVGQEFEVDEKTYEYDGESHIVTVTGTLDGDIIEYKTGSGEWTKVNPTFTEVGKYSVEVRVRNPDYTLRKNQTGEVNITQKAVTIKVSNASKEYGTDDPVFTGTVVGLVVGTDLGDISYERTTSEEAVGTYLNELDALYTNNPNYIVTVEKGDFEIKSTTNDSSLIVTGKKVIYDGKGHSVTVTGILDGEIVEYETESGEWTEVNPAFINVGKYLVKVRVKNADEEKLADKVGTVSITPRSIKIKVNNNDKIYGSGDPTIEKTVTGDIYGNDLGTISTFRIGSNEDVGQYKDVLDASYTENSNYTVDVLKGDFRITAKAVTIKVDNATKVSGKADPVFTGDKKGLVSSSDLIVSYLREGTDEGVGKYPGVLTAKYIENKNYTVTVVDGDFEITETPELVPDQTDPTEEPSTPTNPTNPTIPGSSGGGGSTGGGGGSSSGGSGGSSSGGSSVVSQPEEILVIEEEIPLAGPELNRDDHFQYIQGYTDNTVRPEAFITREEVAAVFFRLLKKEYQNALRTTDHEFTDLEANRWSTKHIATLSKGTILEGYEDGSFKPSKFVTRAELATIASRFDNLSSFESDDFNDIAGHWANKYINSAAKKGWLKGYEDGSFKPNQNITRGEFVTLVNSVLGRRVHKEDILPEAKQFSDLLESKWYYTEMQEAINSHHYERKDDDYEVWTEMYDSTVEM